MGGCDGGHGGVTRGVASKVHRSCSGRHSTVDSMRPPSTALRGYPQGGILRHTAMALGL